MADSKKPLPIEPESIEVEIPPQLRAGVYANTITVTATDSELVLNFIVLNPNDNPKGTLVSRVVIPPSFAEKIAEILNGLAEKMKAK